ncbi:hypothetical protein MTR62_10385 [Novosphingobium sp. 1949]|uniref:Thioredoxin domain-containing protein n=1 Tax=Novosphingobium organovorum TaxID=2930092 RepID=A0ABT0BDG3_9SPHN|nr:hypothetical protein [Novosphingobium organovorum]MCJ2183094.1 hypothetical protein [Novosphingobium organovorum]
MNTQWDRRRLLAHGARASAGLASLASLPTALHAEILGKGFEGLAGPRADTARTLLQSARQVSFGTGKDVWMWLSSLCPWCQKFFRETPSLTVPGFRIHYIPFILGDAETGAVLKVIDDPSEATFLKFMRRELGDAPPIAYSPYYSGPLDYTGGPSTRLSRHHAHIRLIQTAFDADAGYPTETGLNRQLSTPRTFFRTQKGALLMWGGAFGARQFDMLRGL